VPTERPFEIGDHVILTRTGETGVVVEPRKPHEYERVGKNTIPVAFDDDPETVWYVPSRRLVHDYDGA